MHRFDFVDILKEWRIICSEFQKEFNPKLACFKEKGICPFCGKNAYRELEERKKRKKEMIEEKREKERLESKNTLEGWF